MALITWYLARSKEASSMRFYDAQTINELIESLERLQGQVIKLSQEMMQMRIDYEARIATLKEGYEKEIAKLRARIIRNEKKMREAGIEPVNGDGTNGN